DMSRWCQWTLGVGVLMLVGCESFELDAPGSGWVPASAAEAVAAGAPSQDAPTVFALINNVDLSLLLERKARREGYRVLSRERLPGLGVVLLEFAVPRGLDPARAAAELERLEPHATAAEDVLYTLGVAQARAAAPATMGRHFADEMIGWPAHGCTSQRRLGMIDSAVDRRAPALAGHTIETRSFVGEVGASHRSHGTAVAQTLLGGGRLGGASLHAAVVMDETKPASSAGPRATTLIRALDWLVQREVELINISLAGPYNRALDRAVQAATSRGVVLVAAVGNEGPASPPRYPAAFPDVIAVTAVDAAMRAFDGAGVGDHVDFAAPGVDIYVPADGAGRYVTGTSFASPFVVSIIAGDPRLATLDNAQALRIALGQSARDLGDPGRDAIFGYGLAALGQPCAAAR
ncbi:MAG: S8 family serine peptidase, partial [Pseudomonadota bacterium]